MALHGLIFLSGFLGSSSTTSCLGPSWLAVPRGVVHSATDHFLWKIKIRRTYQLHKDKENFLSCDKLRGPKHFTLSGSPKLARNTCIIFCGDLSGRRKYHPCICMKNGLSQEGRMENSTSGLGTLSSRKLLSLLGVFFCLWFFAPISGQLQMLAA